MYCGQALHVKAIFMKDSMSFRGSIISLRVMKLLEKTVYASIMSRCKKGLEGVNLISSQIPIYFPMNFMTSMLTTKS